MFPNRYPGMCISCGARQEIGVGFIEKIGPSWVTYCREHKPQASITLSLQGERVVFSIERMDRETFDSYYLAVKGATYDSEAKCFWIPANKPTILSAVLGALLDSPLLGALVSIAPEVKNLVTQYEEATKERLASFLARADVGLKLFPFQEVGAGWLASRSNALLADDMGLGKTIQVLAAHPEGAPLLVVGPAIAKGVWLRELKRWRKDIEDIHVCTGRGSFQWPDNGQAVLTNYDILPTVQELDALRVGHDTTLVIDEIHNAKNHNAVRYQRLEAVTKEVRGAAGRIWGLSATPLLNRPPELWNILKILDLHTEAYGTWGRFSGAFGGKTGRPGPEAAESLSSVMLRRTKNEVLQDLPTKIHDPRVVGVSLTRSENEEVRAAEQAFLDQGTDVDFNCLSKARAILAKAKIPALNALVDEYEEAGEPIVVFSCHRDPIDQLGERKGWALITGDTPNEQRTEIEDAFQKGELRGIGASVRAAGIAITLTRAANCIFVDRAWTPGLNLQAEDRLCRIGQTRPVNIIQLIAEDSLDQRVEEIISEKTALIENSVEKASNLRQSIEQVLPTGLSERLKQMESVPDPVPSELSIPGTDVSDDCPF